MDLDDFRGTEQEHEYLEAQEKIDSLLFLAELQKEPDFQRKQDLLNDIRMQEAFEAGRKEMRHKVARYAEPLNDNPTAMDFLGQ